MPIYVGVPAGREGFRIAKKMLQEIVQEEKAQSRHK